MANFWRELKKPIMAIAPMANVTDAAFRRMFAQCGKPDVFWTEFVSVEGLLSKGKENLLPDFWFEKDEHPIVAQIFGAKPEQFEEIAGMIRELGFDGIDINMGCPDTGVEKQGAGAALIKNPALAKEIIRALKRGAGDLPISVKTRIGYATSEVVEWISALLEENLAALTVHLRTRNEMSKVSAHWELAHEIVALRDRYAPETILLGNGDVRSLEEARARAKESGMDGVMVGTGIFGNPWFFSGRTPDTKEKLTRMMEHVELFEKLFHEKKRFAVMKKHFKAYTTGFEGSKELRIALMATENAREVRKITEEFLR
jgi:nifR3 family TIM-barrel protein